MNKANEKIFEKVQESLLKNETSEKLIDNLLINDVNFNEETGDAFVKSLKYMGYYTKAPMKTAFPTVYYQKSHPFIISKESQYFSETISKTCLVEGTLNINSCENVTGDPIINFIVSSAKHNTVKLLQFQRDIIKKFVSMISRTKETRSLEELKLESVGKDFIYFDSLKKFVETNDMMQIINKYNRKFQFFVFKGFGYKEYNSVSVTPKIKFHFVLRDNNIAYSTSDFLLKKQNPDDPDHDKVLKQFLAAQKDNIKYFNTNATKVIARIFPEKTSFNSRDINDAEINAANLTEEEKEDIDIHNLKVLCCKTTYKIEIIYEFSSENVNTQKMNTDDEVSFDIGNNIYDPKVLMENINNFKKNLLKTKTLSNGFLEKKLQLNPVSKPSNKKINKNVEESEKESEEEESEEEAEETENESETESESETETE